MPISMIPSLSPLGPTLALPQTAAAVQQAGAVLPGDTAGFSALLHAHTDLPDGSPVRPAVAAAAPNMAALPVPPTETGAFADKQTSPVAEGEGEGLLLQPMVEDGGPPATLPQIKVEADEAGADINAPPAAEKDEASEAPHSSPPAPPVLEHIAYRPAKADIAPAPMEKSRIPSAPEVQAAAPTPERKTPSRGKSTDDADARMEGMDRAGPAAVVAAPAPFSAVSPIPPAAQPGAVVYPAEAAEPQEQEDVPDAAGISFAKQEAAHGPGREKAAKEQLVLGAADKMPVAPPDDMTGQVRPSVPDNRSPLPDNGPAIPDNKDSGLSPPLLTQTMAPVTSRPPASLYPPSFSPAAPAPTVQARPGRIGADIGVEIAKVARAGRDHLLIRLDPREMGRIDVRLSFDRDGVMRAVMSADSPAALDMLRRESADLNRALANAGVRSDTQSLRFDTRSGDQGQGAGQGWQRGQQSQNSGSRGIMDDGAVEFADPFYRPLRTSGQVDLMA